MKNLWFRVVCLNSFLNLCRKVNEFAWIEMFQFC